MRRVGAYFRVLALADGAGGIGLCQVDRAPVEQLPLYRLSWFQANGCPPVPCSSASSSQRSRSSPRRATLSVDKTGADVLLRVFRQRYERGSVVITTSQPFEHCTRRSTVCIPSTPLTGPTRRGPGLAVHSVP